MQLGNAGHCIRQAWILVSLEIVAFSLPANGFIIHSCKTHSFSLTLHILTHAPPPPSSQLERYAYILDLYMSYGLNVMLVGEQGTGKTSFVEVQVLPARFECSAGDGLVVLSQERMMTSLLQ